VLVARRADALAAVAADVREKHGVDVRTLAFDLAQPTLGEAMHDATQGIEIGLGVYNAASSFIAPLLERPVEDALRVVDVNCAGPLRFIHALAPAMVARGRGGIVLMSSLAGFQGGPRLAPYAASKAFNVVLGESLWHELRDRGIDVLVSCPGAIRTPNYLKTTDKEAPGTLDALDVAQRTLSALGSGPTFVPGATNKLARFFLGRFLSRAAAVGIMAKNTADLHDG